jgi:hypothetical protein
LTFIYSEDDYDPVYAQKVFQQIQLLAGPGVGMSKFLFGLTSPDADVYAASCNTQGMVYANGHGLMEPGNPNQTPGFAIGQTWLCGTDGAKFSKLNPLYIACSCFGDAYQYGECFTEAWMRAAKGPVTMVGSTPTTYPVPPGGGLTSSEQGFWTDLFASKTIGQALYDNCAGAEANPLNLFGDPSSVIFKPCGSVGQSLVVVPVGAPAINSVFSTSSQVFVTDTTSKIVIKGTSGSGFLQSRTYTGQPGSPGAGLFAYEYRIDLTNLVGVLNAPAITSLTIDFGPVINTLDYNGNGEIGDQVFVVTSGGLGSVGPISAIKNGNSVTFDFGAGISAGASPGKGLSSYFFGLVSTKPPKSTSAHAVASLGGPLNLQARTPDY